MFTAVVTDSTCDLSAGERAALGVTVVPLIITIDGREYRDGVDLSSERFYQAMAQADELPSTSQPAPAQFLQVYRSLADAGAQAIVSIHIAAALSGTCNSVRLAAQESPVPVEVVDSLSATAGLALLVDYACELRDAGASASDIADATRQAAGTVTFRLACDTVENLVKGGRMPAEQGEQVSALNVKPIFGFDVRGALTPVGKARGMNGAVRSLAHDAAEAIASADGAKAQAAGARAANAPGAAALRIRYLHAGNEEAVDRVRSLLAEDGVAVRDGGVCLCGATIGTHVGPGAVGFACMPDPVCAGESLEEIDSISDEARSVRV